MGSTSQSTATLDTSAYKLALNPRSTSTGKVAALAQAETQSVSHTLFRSSGKRRLFRASSAPANVPSTAAKESSKPMSQTA